MADDDNTVSALAFRLLYEVSEKLKDEGLDKEETWALMFVQLQNLQAADFGMGSERHRETVQMQHDSLCEDLNDWPGAEPH